MTKNDSEQTQSKSIDMSSIGIYVGSIFLIVSFVLGLFFVGSVIYTIYFKEPSCQDCSQIHGEDWQPPSSHKY